MTDEQIKNYEYCKAYLEAISQMIAKIPFKSQLFGCGSQSDRITFELEEIHLDMYNGISNAISTAKEKINKKIETL